MLDADDQGGAGGFEDVVGIGVQFVDLHDAFHLRAQPVYESEVAVGNPGNGGQGLGVGEVVGVEVMAELAPSTCEDKAQFVFG